MPKFASILLFVLFAFSQNFSRDKSSPFHTCISEYLYLNK